MAENHRTLLKRYRIAVSLLIAIIIGIIVSGSLFVYDYTEHDPTFCVNCHIMESAFDAWETSVHRDIECHDCHYATVLEKNQMLFKTFMENPGKVSERPHEKIIVPSSMCIQCHWDGREELPKISRSTGHAMHWFKASIECTSCHAIRLHRFEAEQRLCVNCHKSASVILEGMEEMKCADCHNFRGAGLKPDVQTCVNCHPYRELPPPAGRVLAHQQFECNTCHNTHDKKIRPESTCAKCHFLTLKRGQHPVHIEALGEECMTCHKAHGWRISKESAKTLCAECHEPYPLKFFRTEKS